MRSPSDRKNGQKFAADTVLAIANDDVDRNPAESRGAHLHPVGTGGEAGGSEGAIAGGGGQASDGFISGRQVAAADKDLRPWHRLLPEVEHSATDPPPSHQLDTESGRAIGIDLE